MKTYTFIIGSADDFEAIEDLMDYVEQEGYDGNLNYSIWEFDCPADCSEEIVTMMGRGYAFSNDWCMDHTFSFLVTGALDGDAEKAAIQAGIDAREALKESRRAAQHDAMDKLSEQRDPVNDPRDW
jgi:hypothetical protein